MIGIPEEKIVRLGKEDNFWEIGTGPADLVRSCILTEARSTDVTALTVSRDANATDMLSSESGIHPV